MEITVVILSISCLSNSAHFRNVDSRASLSLAGCYPEDREFTTVFLTGETRLWRSKSPGPA